MIKENSNYNEVVVQYLNTALINLIQDQQLTLSQLKVILLICYHQFIEEKPNKLILGLLISTLKQIVDIEDNNVILETMESISASWDEKKADEYLENLIHPRVKKLIQTLEES